MIHHLRNFDLPGRTGNLHRLCFSIFSPFINFYLCEGLLSGKKANCSLTNSSWSICTFLSEQDALTSSHGFALWTLISIGYTRCSFNLWIVRKDLSTRLISTKRYFLLWDLHAGVAWDTVFYRHGRGRASIKFLRVFTLRHAERNTIWPTVVVLICTIDWLFQPEFKN